MKSDVIVVSSQEGLERALDLTARTAAYGRLSGQNSLHLRLLTEEMMGMVRSITGLSEGEFWIEIAGQVYQLHLKVVGWMSKEQREALVSTSRSGRNEAYRGIMGRIRAFFEMNADGPTIANPFMMNEGTPMYGSMAWSMAQYREDLRQYLAQAREGAEAAWDELEKSVVSHVADDIKVSVKDNVAEMTIIKRMD